jgi:AbrB family looped-hinge helix DNA binding protein
MSQVTVSPKFQVVIPRAIRESLAIKVGEKLHALEYRGRIELVPVKAMREARGMLQGMNTDLPREPDRV